MVLLCVLCCLVLLLVSDGYGYICMFVPLGVVHTFVLSSRHLGSCFEMRSTVYARVCNCKSSPCPPVRDDVFHLWSIYAKCLVRVCRCWLPLFFLFFFIIIIHGCFCFRTLLCCSGPAAPALFIFLFVSLQVLEPVVDATIITPSDCLGAMLTLLKNRRGRQTSLT